MLKKALFYLGLGSDEEYDHYDDRVAGVAYPPRDETPPSASVTGHDTRRGPGSATVRPIMPSGTSDSPVRPVAAVDTPPIGGNTGPIEGSAGGRVHPPGVVASAVRIVDDPPTRSSTANPHTASPTTFEEAPRIGDRLKAGQPVILNLQNAERSNRRRLLDFASGACFALGGRMERVADQVFLITPPAAVARSMSDPSPDDENLGF